jgi:bifunctional DNase/RNase
MIAVKVEQLFLSKMGYVLLLKGDADPRSLPIFIGPAEAQAIALRMTGAKVPRPLTHDLLKNILDQQECRLKRVEVCELREGTFYARLVLERDGVDMAADSRPSDAIALALRCGAPMFVHEAVMNEAGQFVEKKAEAGAPKAPAAGSEDKDPKEHKPHGPLDHLKLDLQKAIEAERYEDAARLRDEIKRLETPRDKN